MYRSGLAEEAAARIAVHVGQEWQLKAVPKSNESKWWADERQSRQMLASLRIAMARRDTNRFFDVGVPSCGPSC